MFSIVLKTTNLQKAAEYRKQLRAHGVKFSVSAQPLDSLIAGYDFVLVEESNLSTSDQVNIPFEDLEREMVGTLAYNRAHLEVHQKGMPTQVFQKTLKGYLSPKQQTSSEEVFGWDAIFVLEEGGFYLTYHEMRMRGIKQSARDYLIAQFIQKYLMLNKQCGLKWSEMDGFKNQQVLDFKWDIVEWVHRHPFIGKAFTGPDDLKQLVYSALANGLFFRAAKSRPQRNYWLPGMNAGIPLTEKKDAFHEATFMLHDFIHFSFPDLLPPSHGGKWSAVEVRLYCAWRMFSEALSMFYADGVFVSEVKNSNFEYDYGKRKIYPLYEEMGESLLPAIVKWMILGNKSGFQYGKLSEEFFDKYDSFVAADWRWTIANSIHLQQNPIKIPSWHKGLSVSDFSLPEDFSLLEITDYLLDNYKSILFDAEPQTDISNEEVQSQAFRRWLAGQMIFFDAWAGQPGITAYKEMLEVFTKSKNLLTSVEIEHCQNLFRRAVDLIPLPEESKTAWCEIYPVFPPSYVGYDSKLRQPLQDSLISIWSQLP